MAKRLEQFTNEQIEILLRNPNVADATKNTIKFTPEFKKLALQKTDEGMSPNDIFKEAGFDLKIIGKKTPNNRIRAWKFYERHSNKNNTKYFLKDLERIPFAEKCENYKAVFNKEIPKAKPKVVRILHDSHIEAAVRKMKEMEKTKKLQEKVYAQLLTDIEANEKDEN